MRRLLIIGSGDVALRALPLLLPHYRVYALLRNPARHAEWRARGAIPLPGDLDNPPSLARIAGLADVVLHFAPPPALGASDLRTRCLLATLSRGTLPKRLVYISTTGIYGDCAGATASETRTPHPQTTRAKLRIDAERQIRNWAKRNHVTAAILRVPGIYAADRLPLARIRMGTPAIAHDEDSYTNHIHADDLARIAVAALFHGKPNRVYHACDDSNLKMGEYFDAVADAYGLPHAPRLSRAEIEYSVSPALLTFMRESRRLLNRRMKAELHVRLHYPTVASMLASHRITPTTDCAFTELTPLE